MCPPVDEWKFFTPMEHPYKFSTMLINKPLAIFRVTLADCATCWHIKCLGLKHKIAKIFIRLT